MESINLKLKVWRQRNNKDAGHFEMYDMPGVSTHMSFLEMMDVLNERLIRDGKDPVAFDHDCREGICGMCSQVINGVPHGGQERTTVCQLHMRKFSDGDSVTLEPWRAKAFPVLKDLIVDRSSFDRIIQAGGFISAATGTAQDANNLPVSKQDADDAMDSAACIGCGACVAACPNASASLFTAAKITHLGKLPQGQPERYRRALKMVEQMDAEGFGGCTLFGECQEACPKGISIDVIKRMNGDYIYGSATAREDRVEMGAG